MNFFSPIFNSLSFTFSTLLASIPPLAIIFFPDFELAERSLGGVVKLTAASDLFFGLVRSQLATVLMDQKKYPQAVLQLEEIINNKTQVYFHPHALVRLGTCYLEMGEAEQAKAAFNKVVTDFADTQAAQEAKNFQKLVSFKKGA